MNFEKRVYLQPQNISDLIASTGNIYESTVIVAKRSKQILANKKEELNRKLEEFVSIASERDTLDLSRQCEITKYYERLPKPILEATQEFLEDELLVRYIDN